jgi:hypothetical protein
MIDAIEHVLNVANSYGLPTKTGGANGEAAGGTQLRGMFLTHSHFCFGQRWRRHSPLRVA